MFDLSVDIGNYTADSLSVLIEFFADNLHFVLIFSLVPLMFNLIIRILSADPSYSSTVSCGLSGTGKKKDEEIRKEAYEFAKIYTDCQEAVIKEYKSKKAAAAAADEDEPDVISHEKVIKAVPCSRNIPRRCPSCWGIPDDSGECPYCGVKF